MSNTLFTFFLSGSAANMMAGFLTSAKIYFWRNMGEMLAPYAERYWRYYIARDC
ncbi:MAG: hypothetical protein OXT74_03730 [Candidatus Poribacteria bacterium]|nr:hypothetical protein [Candidatus Poribacteria bacterium]